MTRPVTVNIPHTLGADEARRRLEQGFAKISQQLSSGLMGVVSMQQRWEGDTLHFEGGAMGQKLTGRLEVKSDTVQIQIDVPEMLAALTDRILVRVQKETKALLEKK
jgi:hypothetical protein